jgi:F0F1-type ATP synthase membrane subunit b/b'
MGQLLTEVLRQVAGEPVLFIAEVVQSALLIAILVWAGRRYGSARLAARRSRIASELEAADVAERESLRIRTDVPVVVAQARESAEGILRSAREQAEKERAASVTAVEAEARQVVAQAQKALETELTGIRREASEHLVQLTTEAARRYLDEMLGETERRALTQKAIIAFLDQVEASAVADGAGAT